MSRSSSVVLITVPRIRVVDPDPGSGSVLDPYSIGSVDPDPYLESGSVFGIRIRIQEGKNDPQK